MQHSSDDGMSDNSNQNNGPQQLELSEEIPLVAAFIENLESIVQYIVNTSVKHQLLFYA